MIVAITNVTSSLSRVMCHRMVPTSSLVTIALLTVDNELWFRVGLKKKSLPSVCQIGLRKGNCSLDAFSRWIKNFCHFTLQLFSFYMAAQIYPCSEMPSIAARFV